MVKILYAGCLGLSQPFWRNSLLKCVSQPKITKKFTKTLVLGVIDVDSFKMHVTSACYVMQHVCLSATVLTLDKPIAAKKRLFRRVSLFLPLVRGPVT